MTDKQTINMVDDSIVVDFVQDPASYYYGLTIRNLLLGDYEEARRYLNKLIAYEMVKED